MDIHKLIKSYYFYKSFFHPDFLILPQIYHLFQLFFVTQFLNCSVKFTYCNFWFFISSSKSCSFSMNSSWLIILSFIQRSSRYSLHLLATSSLLNRILSALFLTILLLVLGVYRNFFYFRVYSFVVFFIIFSMYLLYSSIHFPQPVYIFRF